MLLFSVHGKLWVYYVEEDSMETHSTCGLDREAITTTSSIHTEAWWKLGGIKTFC